MSHCNITLPNIYSTEASLREELATTNAKLTLATMYPDMAIKNLESLFERVKNGEETYLCYPDGEIIYIGRVDKPLREQKA